MAPLLLSALFAVAVLAPGATPSGAASGFTSDLERTLKKLDRDLCKSVESLKCKRKAPATKAGKPKAKVKTSPTAEQARPAVARTIPIPRQKPVQAVATQAAGIDAADIQKPRMKPEMPDAAIAEKPVPLPRAKPSLPQNEPKAEVVILLPPSPAPKIVVPPPQSSQSGDQCRNALKALGMRFETPATSVDAGRCSVADPVKLTSFDAGGETVGLPDGPVLNCSFALSFGKWLKAEAAPIVQRTAKSALDTFYTGPGFQCRGRNGDSTSKISEHGYGNAVDVTFFKMKDGRSFQVKDALDPMSPAYETLAELRASGCRHFTTVLGPGSNAAHAEHFHFDLGTHGSSGTYRICE